MLTLKKKGNDKSLVNGHCDFTKKFANKFSHQIHIQKVNEKPQNWQCVLVVTFVQPLHTSNYPDSVGWAEIWEVGKVERYARREFSAAQMNTRNSFGPIGLVCGSNVWSAGPEIEKYHEFDNQIFHFNRKIGKS